MLVSTESSYTAGEIQNGPGSSDHMGDREAPHCQRLYERRWGQRNIDKDDSNMVKSNARQKTVELYL